MTISWLASGGWWSPGVVLLVRHLGQSGPMPRYPPRRCSTPKQMLAERFARGEIDEPEYASRWRRCGGGCRDDRSGLTAKIGGPHMVGAMRRIRLALLAFGVVVLVGTIGYVSSGSAFSMRFTRR